MVSEGGKEHKREQNAQVKYLLTLGTLVAETLSEGSAGLFARSVVRCETVPSSWTSLTIKSVYLLEC